MSDCKSKQNKRILELDVLLDNFNSTISSRPLTRQTEVPQVPSIVFTFRIAECEEIFSSAGDFMSLLRGIFFRLRERAHCEGCCNQAYCNF